MYFKAGKHFPVKIFSADHKISVHLDCFEKMKQMTDASRLAAFLLDINHKSFTSFLKYKNMVLKKSKYEQ